MQILKFFFTIGVLILCMPLVAQDPVARNYSVDDGLPSNEVYDVFEDSLGYIWFATDHGISRFDGYSFKNYSTDDGLVSNTIFGFFEDNRRRVWMRTFNSTLCYMANGKIYPYAHNNSLQRFLGKNFIETFAIDSVGDLWFMSICRPFGLYRQDHQTGAIEKIKLKPGFDAFIRELSGGKFIAGIDLDNGADAQPAGEDTLVYNDHTWLFRLKSPFTGRGLVRTARSGKDHYLFSCNSELTELFNGRIKKRILSGYFGPASYIYTDRTNQFWVSKHGLFCWEQDTAHVLFRETIVYSVLQDKRGSYWLTTANKGVLFLPDIRLMDHKPTGHDELKLLAKNAGYLYLVDGKNGLSILKPPSTGPGFQLLKSWESVKKYDVNDLMIDDQKRRLFLGVVSYPLDEFTKGTAITAKPVLYSYIAGHIRRVTASGKYIYFAGNNGWGFTDRDGNKIYSSHNKGFSAFCTAICTDPSEKVWIGTGEGLFYFHNGQTLPFRPGESLFRQRVTDIKYHPSGLLIVSTRGSGIIVMDKERVYNLRASNGLTTDLCGRLVLEDSLFWVCSNNGLNKVTVKKSNSEYAFHITRIQSEHGLPSNLVNDALPYGDFLLLATGKGLAWFNKHLFSINPYTPPVYIDVVTANQRVLGNNPGLDYTETNLSFGFTGLLYNSPGKIHYRYKLEGYEDEWHYTMERSTRYFNLPAGHYRFVVSAMNENGVWNDHPAEYTFTIPLHFSKTWWFRTIVIACIGFAFFLVINYYARQKRLRERITSDMLLAELQTLRSQMKPHFIFNSLNSIQYFILENDEESAHLYLSRFSDLIRRILENTRRNTISLAREIETLELYLTLEKMRFGKNFDYTISITNDIIPENIEIPPMLVQPYLENAIWHGLMLKKENARLWLRIFTQGKLLVFEIEDNGIGRKQAQEKNAKREHQSTGMSNIEERIAILNRISGLSVTLEVIDLYDVGGQAAGTKVLLKLSNVSNV